MAPKIPTEASTQAPAQSAGNGRAPPAGSGLAPPARQGQERAPPAAQQASVPALPAATVPAQPAGQKRGFEGSEASPAKHQKGKPKGKVDKQLAAPRVVHESIYVSLDEISTSKLSGWRDVDRSRVEELKAAFRRGEYGQNLLRKPSVVEVSGHRVLCTDGGMRLLDGKHTAVALKEMHLEFEQQTEDAKCEFSEALVSVFEVGLAVSVLEFPAWDDDIGFAWAVGIHDGDVNRFKTTSIKDLVDVVHRYRNRAPGGTWKATQALLEDVYGQSRRMMVFRMVTAARHLSQRTLEKLAASSLPPSYIYENKFFIPGGATGSAQLLSETYQCAAIDNAHAEMQAGKAMSGAHFASDFCAPLRYAESWVLSRRKDFGKLADLPAFGRLEAYLMGGRARVPIMMCMKSRIRLDGVSDEQPGIEQCRSLIKELQALKSQPAGGARDGLAPLRDGAGSLGSGGGVEPLGGGEAAGEPTTGIAPVGTSVVTAIGDEVDPAMEAANAKVDIALAKVTWYESLEELSVGLPAVVLPGARVLIHVDVPTSKSSVIAKLIDKAESLVKLLPAKRTTKIIVTTGNRMNVLSTTLDKLSISFPQLSTFWVTLTHGDTQHKKRKNSALVVAVPPESTEEIPTVLKALAARAQKGEKTFLRCLDRDCPLRPAEALSDMVGDEPLSSLTATCELNPDDLDCDADDGNALEAPEDDDDDDVIMAPEPARSFVVDLWPFAFGREYYKRIHNSVFSPAALPNHVVMLTPSAHPGPVWAAVEHKAHAHVLLDRVNPHSKAHGVELLKESLRHRFHKEEKAKAGPGQMKRYLSTELAFVVIEAPMEQLQLFHDAAKSATPSWRGTVDHAPSSADLESAVPRLIASELDASHLFVKEESGMRLLCTSRAIKHGEVVCQAKCLLFSDLRLLTEFVNTDSNSALLDGPLLQINNIHTADGADITLFAVQVGLSMFIRDWRGKRGRPNVKIEVDPAVGANDGFISFKVSTQNATGIGAGQAIFADLGETFRQLYADPQAAKKYCGALDLVFARQLAAQTDNDNETETGSAGGGGTGSGGIGSGGSGTGSAGGAGTGSAGGGAGSAGTGSGGAGSGGGSRTGSAGGAGNGSSGVILATTSAYAVQFSDSNGVTVKAEKAHRIPPKTVLHIFADGVIDEHQGDFITFEFTKPKDLVVDANTKQVMTLADVIKSGGADKMYGHGPFTKGVPPPSFAKKKDYKFIIKDSESGNKVINWARSTNHQKIQCLWLVSVASGKITPKGVAVVTKAQVVLKAGCDTILQ